MPVFTKHLENGETIEKFEILNKDNVEQYLSSFGQERLDGYKDAVADLLNFLDENFATSAQFRKKIGYLYMERQEFLKSCQP